MNHEYQPNPEKEGKCLDCGYPQDKHGPNALCECPCNTTGTLEFYIYDNKMALLTRDCIEREKKIQFDEQDAIKKALEHQTPDKQEARLEAYNKVAKPYDELIRNARRIDEQLHVSTDIFNAKTIAISEIRAAIWADENINADDKYFELAKFCKERISHFRNLIFDLDKKKIEAYSEQKSWHIQLNDLANKLRTDQREQLRISDINYDVKMPKVVTPRAIKNSTKKPDKGELKKLAAELKMPEYMLLLTMTSKNWTIEQVGNHFRRAINEGLSMSTPTPVVEKKQDTVEVITKDPIIIPIEPEVVDMDSQPEIEDIE